MAATSTERLRASPLPAAALLAVISGLALYPFTAKPLEWDDLYYMAVAFHPEPKAWILNRYGHVYAMKAFMWLTGDPFVGAWVYWCAIVGTTVGALAWAALQLPPEPRRVLAWTLFLFAGQWTIFSYVGIVIADFAIMALLTLAIGLVLARIGRGADLSAADAAALGALFWLAVKSKETALPSLMLVGLFFIAPSGRLRCDRGALQRLCCWIGGVAAAQALFVALDAFLLADPLFSLSASSWGGLLAYNTDSTLKTGGDGILSWLSPGSCVSVGLYILAGGSWARRETDRRLLYVLTFPALFMLALMCYALYEPTPTRYAIPALPALSLLTAVCIVRSLRELRAPSPRGRLAARLIVALLLVAGAVPLTRVVIGLASFELQRETAPRYAGLYQIGRSVELQPHDILFVSTNLYGGAIRPGVLKGVARLNFNVPFASATLTTGTAMPADADYALLDYLEYRDWRAATKAPEDRAVVSDDRSLALVCVRGTCPLR